MLRDVCALAVLICAVLLPIVVDGDVTAVQAIAANAALLSGED